MNQVPLTYTGRIQPSSEEWMRDGIAPYFPGPDLVEAVNLAIYLGRPLLLEGEPGCGKTSLARAVAYELGLPYEEWYAIKSTSQARDGLYTFDAVARLRDAQAPLFLRDESAHRDLDPTHYVTLGPLGRAFQASQPTVLLIDEIDKANQDFFGDLLVILDELSFVIEETGTQILASQRPIVFITSNNRKEIPGHFRRRCLVHVIEFPEPDRLRIILRAHFPAEEPDVVEQAAMRFVEFRQDLTSHLQPHEVRPGIDLLISWFQILRNYPDGEALLAGDELPYLDMLLPHPREGHGYLQAQLSGELDGGGEEQYNIAAVRDLLKSAFTSKALWRFLQSRPDFDPILTQINRDDNLEDMIDVLTEYCRTRVLFAELLSEIQQDNPKQYERFARRLLPSPL